MLLSIFIWWGTNDAIMTWTDDLSCTHFALSAYTVSFLLSTTWHVQNKNFQQTTGSSPLITLFPEHLTQENKGTWSHDVSAECTFLFHDDINSHTLLACLIYLVPNVPYMVLSLYMPLWFHCPKWVKLCQRQTARFINPPDTSNQPITSDTSRVFLSV